MTDPLDWKFSQSTLYQQLNSIILVTLLQLETEVEE
eukprot:gene10997-12809_t